MIEMTLVPVNGLLAVGVAAFSLKCPVGFGLVEGQRVRFAICIEPLEGG